MLPNLLVVGAQKSGTTSLHRLLEGHPGIFVPPRPQEIHFFDFEENYAKGAAWYRAHFAAWSGQPWCGQTSPLYMYEPRVPERIARLLPDARCVCILRNPVERARSHYWHGVKMGFERLSFREAVEQEPERLSRGFEARRLYSYVDRGRYATQIRRLLDWIDPSRLLILLFDELRHSPSGIRRQLASFLELPLEGFPTGGGAWHNRGGRPRVPALQRLTRPMRRWLPIVAAAFDRLNLDYGEPPPLGEAERQLLHRLLDPEIGELGRLTGLPTASWLTS